MHDKASTVELLARTIAQIEAIMGRRGTVLERTETSQLQPQCWYDDKLFELRLKRDALAAVLRDEN